VANRKPVIGIIGGAEATQAVADLAYETGRQVALKSCDLVCGGLGGVMEAASRGAAEAGGTVIGILPGNEKGDANPSVTVAIPTGMGMGRNVLVVRTADVLIAFPGSYGTLSEIALALNLGKPVVYMPGSWDVAKLGKVDRNLYKEAFDAQHALGLALGLIAGA
jgi:uncharacterized protein (TIGR00725 family)